VASALPSSAPAASSEEVELDEIKQSEGFDTLPDGRKVPELPANAPKEVSFGVVQVTYQGAQSAPKDARSKADAKAKASALAQEAKQDFAAAVSKGDRGSTGDAGRVPRDVLEPVVEYLLFTLPKGEVYPEPIDTPRGYWIIRRNR
jgi:parvulin-like peptidyl-prolyl isomerase